MPRFTAPGFACVEDGVVNRQSVLPHGCNLMSMAEVVNCGLTGFRLLVARGTESSIYSDVLSVRRSGEDLDRRHVYSFDEVSFHYVAYMGSEPVGCLTVTRATDGRLDCEEFYPARLVDDFRAVTISGCKLKIVSHSGARTTMRTVIRDAWADQLRKNARLDIINATGRLIRIYEKLGYQRTGIKFEHPLLRTDSEMLYRPADPTLGGRLADVFQGIHNPLSDAEVRRILNA